MNLVILACRIMEKEIEYCIKRSLHKVETRFMQKGLHDRPTEKMYDTLQKQINDINRENFDAILLGYGVCSDGIVGLISEHIQMVAPRMHDCIHILSGSSKAYQEFFSHKAYFRSIGWTENYSPEIGPDGKPISIATDMGMNMTYEEMVEKYGKDNADFIKEQLASWTKNYQKIAWIEMGIPGYSDYREQAKQEAQEKGWGFVDLKGDISLLQRLIDGKWDNEREFLVMPPGQQIAREYSPSTDIIRVETLKPSTDY